MKTITIMGVDYPIEYTVEAQGKFAEKGGGLKQVSNILQNNPSFALSAMMQAACNRGKVYARMSGVEYDGPEPLSESDLSAILMPRDMVNVIKTMSEVMADAFKADVETAPEKKTGKKKESSTP